MNTTTLQQRAALAGALAMIITGIATSAHAGPEKYLRRGEQDIANKRYSDAESSMKRGYDWAKREAGGRAPAKFAVGYCKALVLNKSLRFAEEICAEAVKAAGSGPLARQAAKYNRLARTSIVGADESTLSASELTQVAALPGRVKVGAIKPTWCGIASKKYRRKERVIRMIGRRMRSGRNGAIYDQDLGDIATMLCKYPRSADWHKQTGHFVQQYINMTGASVKDAMAAIKARVRWATWTRQRKAFCSNLVVSDEASPAERRAHTARWRTFGCGNANTFWRDPLHGLGNKLEWDLDKTGNIDSEILKTHYVLSCLKVSKRLARSKRLMAPYALCGIDARSLSRAKLEAELRAGSYNTYARTLARESHAVAKAAERTYRRYVDALIKRDPTYKKVFIDVPKRAWAAWQAKYVANKAIYDAAYKTEKAMFGPSKSAMRGCLKPLRAMLAGHVTKAKRKPMKQVTLHATNEVGGILLNALMVCAAYEAPTYFEADLYASLRKKTRQLRGPRAAVYYAVIDAVQAIKKDRERFPMKPQWFGYKQRDSYVARYNKFAKAFGRTHSTVVRGVVRRLNKVKKGRVKVTFKKVVLRIKDQDCKDTNKIQRIMPDGTLKYFRKCWPNGKILKFDVTPAPVIVPGHSAKGIRRGRFGVFLANIKAFRTGRLGFPVAIYKSKRNKRVVAAYGIKM